jgi:hypothetical protein
MVDYSSLQEIIDAGTTNATVLRNNSKNDNGTDTTTGADWLTFNGAAVASVYVSGNTWFGFGSSTEHLKVNRRDTACCYLYREEGTLFGYYKFLKYRWSGYSQYNQTGSTYKQTYDVILFDTGDIVLHLIDIPTSSYSGTFALVAGTTYTYTAPTTASPDVTFYWDKDTSTFSVAYELPAYNPPYTKKFLVRIAGELYTITDGALVKLEATTPTAAVFTEFGLDEAPANNILRTLTGFDVLLWHDSTEYQPKLTAEIKALKPPQQIISDLVDMSDSSILGISAVTITDNNTPLYACSFDHKATWEYMVDGVWTTATSDTEGMTKDVLQAITSEQWGEKIGVGMYFKLILNDGTDAVEKVYVEFTN